MFVDEVPVTGVVEVQVDPSGYAAALRPQFDGIEPQFERRFELPSRTVTVEVTDPSMVAALHGRILLERTGLRVSVPEPPERWCDEIQVSQGYRFLRGTL